MRIDERRAAGVHVDARLPQQADDTQATDGSDTSQA